ncbi:MAG: hypothetical protein Hens3KO_15830 [Henriciella sp.]
MNAISMNIKIASIAGVMLLASGVAKAQVLDDIESSVTQGNQYNEALQVFPDNVEDDDADTSVDGEAGVYVLKKNEIFSVRAIVGTGYSDNPSRTSDSDIESSAAAQMALSIGADTRINGAVDAGTNLVISGTEYETDGAPDSRNVVANAYVGKSLLNGTVFGSVSGTYGQAMNGTFGEATGFYGLSASVTTVRPLTDKVVVRPRLSVSRQWSEVTELDNTSVTTEASASWAIAPKWQATGSLAFTHRIYDDFYEDVTFIERKDDSWRAGVSVSRQINDKVAVSANLTYVDQSSDFFVSDYTSYDGGLSVRIVKRF